LTPEEVAFFLMMKLVSMERLEENVSTSTLMLFMDMPMYRLPLAEEVPVVEASSMQPAERR
jgi:hypothetical protein